MTTEYIDFRNRPPLPDYLAYFDPDRCWAIGRKTGARHEPESFRQRSVERWLSELDEAGISKAVVNGRSSPGVKKGRLSIAESRISNDLLADFQAQYPTRVVGLAGIDASGREHDPVAEIRRSIGKLKLKGVFLEPQRSVGQPDDERLMPIYETCSELGVPVVIMSGPFAGEEVQLTSPHAIDRVANSFPDLKIVTGHGSWPYVREALAICFKHPNVHLSPDVYTFVPGGDEYVQGANTFMENQLLFGSAYPFRHMRDTVEDYVNLPWRDDEVRNKVMAGNAARVLGLTATP